MNMIPLISADPVTLTTCPYCGVGCGVKVTQTAGQVHVEGDTGHPANYGKLCIKGSNLGDTLGLSTRLLQPQKNRKPGRQAISWDEATQTIADKFQQCIDQYGRDSIAFYVSGQLLTEDYYAVNKFVKGYLGTANIDTNSRLCMSSAVAAHKRSFGEDIVPGSYSDFEKTEMVVLVGSNTAWCHPVLYQRIIQAKSTRDNLFVVVIDPRFTSTCEFADLHLPVLPGQDVALFNGLLQYLYRNGYADAQYIEAHTSGLEESLAVMQDETDPAWVSEKTGIALPKLLQFFEAFARTEKVMTLFSQGVNQSSQGTNKANSIINCHLLTGKIGKPGASPFSMTGQPNAMGGREVGGLANMLAAHLELDNPQHQQLVQNFWHSPLIADKPGLKAVDLFRAVESGKIKAIWIMATNPVVSLPDAEQVKRALEKCEFVVVSDICTDTDTTAYADILLPALGWGEKDGTVTNSERRISRQRAFLPAPGEAKADWWAISRVARALGFSGFDFNHPADIFTEHAALSAAGNSHPDQRDSASAFRYFNLSGLTALNPQTYDNLAPVQWPVLVSDELQNMSRPGTVHESDSSAEHIYRAGNFSHVQTRAKFIATAAIDPVNAISGAYPLVLNTGRIRDQWHTMTRTGLSANLSSHIIEPFCEIHPLDALKYGITEKGLVSVESAWGRCVVRANISQNMRRGHIFAPIHWTDQTASDARIGQVVNPEVDAISGEPEFKHTPVFVRPFFTKWQGVLYVRHGQESAFDEFLQRCSWWTKITTAKASRYELADRRLFTDAIQTVKALPGFKAEDYEWLHYDDTCSQLSHSLVLKNGLLVASLYIAPPDLLPNREWVATLFKRERLSAMHRKALLAGLPMSVQANDGPVVCSCFKVGKNKIIKTIREQNISDEKQVTACLKAGGNCGSCLPEIRGLIKACQHEAVA